MLSRLGNTILRIESVNPPEERTRDWKTGNWYLYVRPAPMTPYWRLRGMVELGEAWWNFTRHPWYLREGGLRIDDPVYDNETLADQQDRLGWIMALPDDDDQPEM